MTTTDRQEKTADVRTVVFSLHSDPGRQVHVAGTFNNWNAMQYPLVNLFGDGTYRRIMSLPPGRHEYKYLVDNEWCGDTECTE